MSRSQKATIPVLENDCLDTKLKKKDIINFISENQWKDLAIWWKTLIILSVGCLEVAVNSERQKMCSEGSPWEVGLLTCVWLVWLHRWDSAHLILDVYSVYQCIWACCPVGSLKVCLIWSVLNIYLRMRRFMTSECLFLAVALSGTWGDWLGWRTFHAARDEPCLNALPPQGR